MSFEILVLLFLVLAVLSSVVNRFQGEQRKQDSWGGGSLAPPQPSQGSGRTSLPEDEPEIDLSKWEMFPTPSPSAHPEFEPVEAVQPEASDSRSSRRTHSMEGRPMGRRDRRTRSAEVRRTGGEIQEARMMGVEQEQRTGGEVQEAREIVDVRQVLEARGVFLETETQMVPTAPPASPSTVGSPPIPTEEAPYSMDAQETPYSLDMDEAPYSIDLDETPYSTNEMNRRQVVRLPFDAKSLRSAILYQEVIGPCRADRMPW